MALQELTARHLMKKGGGTGGSILGSIIGGLAGALTAAIPGVGWATAVPLAFAGAGAGSQIGAAVGEEVDPSVNKMVKLVPPKLEGASQNNPMAQIAMIGSAQKALGSTDLPQQVSEDYMGRLSQARDVLNQRLKVGGEWV